MSNLPIVWRPQVDTIHVFEALAFMRQLPDASIDAVITDPPYNLTELAFEQAIHWPVFWSECRRIARNKRTPFILFSQQPFTTDAINSNRKAFRYEIIMEKTMSVGFLNANRRPLQAHENILVFGDLAPEYSPVMETSGVKRASAFNRDSFSGHYNDQKASTYIDDGSRYPRSVWRFAQRNTAFENTVTLHPTQKPLACLERLVLLYTKPGAVILDPFIGSGTTAAAAQKTGRHYIGCDLSAEYVGVAQVRLAQPYTLPLFASIEGASDGNPTFEEAG